MPSNTSARIDALPTGTRLHGYVVESVLGHGGFGIVYMARHFELGGRVAIKEYMPSVLAMRREGAVHPISAAGTEHYEEGLRRFLEEARQLVRFESHPSVVSCRDFFRQNGTAYLVMEYVDGLTLADLLQRREQQGRPFDEAELMAIVRPLLEGLQAIHTAGVLHRDIKPANIIVRQSDERPVLIDFGAAKHFIAEHSSSMAPYTEGYAANEQISEGGQLGPWTDLYALGGVLWRIVAGGNPPWDDPRWSGLNWRPPNPLRVELRMRAVGRGKADPLPTAREVGKGRFSERTLCAIDKCLELWEEDRVQHSSHLQEMLLRNAPGSGTSKIKLRHEPPGSTDDSVAMSNVRQSPDPAGHSNAEYSNDASLRQCRDGSSTDKPHRKESDKLKKPKTILHRFPSKYRKILRRKTRFLFKVFIALTALLMNIVAKDIWFDVEYPLGPALHLTSMLLVYIVLFRWGRTRTSPLKDHGRNQFRLGLLACLWFAVGLYILSLQA